MQDIASEFANHMCDNRNADDFYTDPTSFKCQQVFLYEHKSFSRFLSHTLSFSLSLARTHTLVRSLSLSLSCFLACALPLSGVFNHSYDAGTGTLKNTSSIDASRAGNDKEYYVTIIYNNIYMCHIT